MTRQEWQAAIKAALEYAGRYSTALDIQIYTLASTLRAMDVANNDIDGIETTVIESPQGGKGHPAFRIRKECEDSITKQMKALGLTAEMLMGKDENDPLIELTEGLRQKIG